MKRNIIENQHYNHQDYTTDILASGDYEECSFSNCEFSNADLSNYNFSECTFNDCNLSMINLSKTSLKTVSFKNCKLLGIHFDTCNEFLLSVSFHHCTLNFSSFYKLNLRKTKFIHCSLQEVDFTEANLTQAIFDSCDLSGAIFDNTLLESADLRTAQNYSIDPESNYLRKARFSSDGLAGLLHKYDLNIEWILSKMNSNFLSLNSAFLKYIKLSIAK